VVRDISKALARYRRCALRTRADQTRVVRAPLSFENWTDTVFVIRGVLSYAAL
jgi:hypothetical protein